MSSHRVVGRADPFFSLAVLVFRKKKKTTTKDRGGSWVWERTGNSRTPHF